MAIDRWEPLREVLALRAAMDRFMQEGLLRPTSALFNAARGGFPLDVIETDDGYMVQASLPGIRPADLDVQVVGNTLTIRGERQASAEQATTKQWLLREHRAETFVRTVTLPMPIEVDQSKATYEHGILSLTLPKTETAKPKQIPVTGQVISEKITPTQTNQPTQSVASPSEPADEHQRTQDQVMLASEDSFPASDPPSYHETSDAP